MSKNSRAVSAADANRRFSELLRKVKAGQTFVVTSHGRPVARLVPIDPRDRTAGVARRILLDRLRKESLATIGTWTREELYEDEP
jgi:prevent-host-death family protein